MANSLIFERAFVWEMAIAREELSRELYLQLKKDSENKGLSKIFNMLAGEEAKHIDVIKKMKKHSVKTISKINVVVKSLNIFKKMHKGADDLENEQSQLKVYKKAQEIEKQSMEFYQKRAKLSKDLNQKEIFAKLAGEEKKHYFLLEQIIDFVNRPSQWLENAEWYHFEEY
jgi:rubrerythrin